MKFAEMVVTPEIATKFLKKNKKDNRHLREYHVASMAMAMRTHSWRNSPQPIAFDWNGNLIDGQHRLHAVIQAGVSVPMVIATECDPAVYAVLDLHAKKSAADLLHMPTQIVAIIKAAAAIVTGGWSAIQVDTVELGAFQLQKGMERIPAATSRGFAASSKIAFVLRRLEVPEEEDTLLEQYWKYNRGAQDMWPQLFAIRRTIHDKRSRSLTSGRLDVPEISARTYHALLPKHRDSSRLASIDVQGHLATLRNLVRKMAPDFATAVADEYAIYSSVRSKLRRAAQKARDTATKRANEQQEKLL